MWTPVFDSSAGRVDRRDRRRAVGAGRRLRRQRRIDAARLGGLRQRHVQVHRRRRDLDPHRPRRDAAHRQASPSTRATRTSYSSRRSAICTRPSPERGVFRSRDGGRSWQKVLYKNDNVGAVEVVIDPTNSNVVYAGLWNTRRPPWYTYAPSNGPGGGIFKSTDGGNNWTQLTERTPDRGHRQDGHRGRAEQSAARVRGRRLLASRAGAPQHPRPTRRCVRGGPPRGPGSGRLLPLRRRRRDVDAAVGGPGALGTRLVLRAHRRRSQGRRHRLRAERRRESRTKDGGKTWVRAARLAGRRRLPPGVGVARRPEHGDRRERPGHDHHAQRAQPTIRARSRGARGSISRRRRSTTSRSTTDFRTG